MDLKMPKDVSLRVIYTLLRLMINDNHARIMDEVTGNHKNMIESHYFIKLLKLKMYPR